MLIKTLNRIANNHHIKGTNLILSRTSFHESYEHGPAASLNPQPDRKKIIKDLFKGEAWRITKFEAKRIKEKFTRFNMFSIPERNVTNIFEHFDDPTSFLKRWRPAADSDSNHGFSTANIDVSPYGHALFHGTLDTRVPDDGVTNRSGFVALIGPRAPKDTLFAKESFYDWDDYNCFEIKYRGDGRKYGIVLNTGTYSDNMRYFDLHAYPLYTRGGPYWQTLQIPFTKFIFAYKGHVQDQQGPFSLRRIKCVAVVLQDDVVGPYKLEIDHMGLRYDTLPYLEDTAYEDYSFSHLKWINLQVDCEPPARD